MHHAINYDNELMKMEQSMKNMSKPSTGDETNVLTRNGKDQPTTFNLDNFCQCDHEYTDTNTQGKADMLSSNRGRQLVIEKRELGDNELFCKCGDKPDPKPAESNSAIVESETL
jgi:hypothetical protein